MSAVRTGVRAYMDVTPLLPSCYSHRHSHKINVCKVWNTSMAPFRSFKINNRFFQTSATHSVQRNEVKHAIT